jgi:hypothetical protein
MAAAACVSHESFVVLSLRVAQTSSLVDVSEVRVTVTSETKVTTLVYPGKHQTIGPDVGTSLSVSFGDDQTGTVVFDVQAVTPTGCAVGHDSTVIRKRAVALLPIALTPATCAPATDGGAGDSPDAVFPGCDPTLRTCGEGMTCHINCTVNQGTCTKAGTGGHGSACQNDNKNCQPGTQCFDYSSLGCNATACLKFCKSNSDCSGVTDGGVGNGAVCLGEVQCSGKSSGYKTCSFDCDPRDTATIGCPVGLKCFRVQGDMDQVDCLCPGAARVKPEGADCPSASDCAPGLICNEMGVTGGVPNRKCRKLCKRSDNNADCPAGQTCTMQAANNIYGVCL